MNFSFVCDFLTKKYAIYSVNEIKWFPVLPIGRINISNSHIQDVSENHGQTLGVEFV